MVARLAPVRHIVELAYHLAKHGGDPLSPASLAVSEGRIRREGYSSCGDLLHCVAEACGHRSPALNRGETWVPGVNLSRWFVPEGRGYAHGGKRVWKPLLSDIEAGDFGCYDYTSPRAHGFIVLAVDHETSEICTADYGQPGGRIYYSKVVIGGGHFPALVRGRELSCLIKVDSLPWQEQPIGVTEYCAHHGISLDPVVPFEYIGASYE